MGVWTTIARIAARINMLREPKLAWLAQRTANPSLSIAIPRSLSRGSRSCGRSAVSGWSPTWGQATGSTAAQAQAWSSVRATAAQVAARLSAARPVNPFAGYNSPPGPQRERQFTEAERQAAADSQAGARAIAAPLQVVAKLVRPMSRASTLGTPEEEEKSPRDPEHLGPTDHAEDGKGAVPSTAELDVGGHPDFADTESMDGNRRLVVEDLVAGSESREVAATMFVGLSSLVLLSGSDAVMNLLHG
ncbi:hypothetical protein H257_02979 [Aphanomyces astaci]|uniref:Uncharacterized protein n=1 Tax=Aphanomyces astaci TaxID=112090 RepID=W4H1V5_APHAT|nr:hypothetical protein H257_02979 [Aphanomyces astaci]ETV85133.1 hypothetical protein H257_02979 [Aphanomyces astaci]|eukprot:XP_009825151.1 hypothetical protein H257_02979 [Aphanomyces astaci]